MEDKYILTPSEVAERFGVDPKTVTRWAKRGRIKFITTPGGHRRYLKTDIDAYFKETVSE